MLHPFVKKKISETFSTFRWRSFFLQGLFALATLIVVGGPLLSAKKKLEKQQISSGLEFLRSQASFEIGESVIDFSATDSYLYAFYVGLLNTLKVSITSLIAALILGALIGFFLVSEHPFLIFLGRSFVDILRNLPLLLILIFLYSMLTEHLPSARSAYSWGDRFFLSQKGFYFPHCFLDGGSLRCERPILKGLNFEGGIGLSPEFLALFLGLAIYTSAFIAEIFRSGIESIPKGQWEAARALALGRFQLLRLVIFPQALRVIVPPLTTQMLNLIKNSSLAVAIGYPDIVSVVNTTLNQTGQALECVAIIMIVYLGLSLLTSMGMNWYNRRIQIIER